VFCSGSVIGEGRGAESRSCEDELAEIATTTCGPSFFPVRRPASGQQDDDGGEQELRAKARPHPAPCHVSLM